MLSCYCTDYDELQLRKLNIDFQTKSDNLACDQTREEPDLDMVTIKEDCQKMSFFKKLELITAAGMGFNNLSALFTSVKVCPTDIRMEFKLNLKTFFVGKSILKSY